MRSMNKILFRNLISLCIVVNVCIPYIECDDFDDYDYGPSSKPKRVNENESHNLNGYRKNIEHEGKFNKKLRHSNAEINDDKILSSFSGHYYKINVRGVRPDDLESRDVENSSRHYKKVRTNTDSLGHWKDRSDDEDDPQQHSFRGTMPRSFYPPSYLQTNAELSHSSNSNGSFSSEKVSNYRSTLNLNGSRNPQEGPSDFQRTSHFANGPRRTSPDVNSSTDKIGSNNLRKGNKQNTKERGKSHEQLKSGSTFSNQRLNHAFRFENKFSRRPFPGQKYLDDLPERLHQQRDKDFRDPQSIPLAERLVGEKRPNIILMITDDLDTELGSLNYMPRLLQVMGGQGALFPNAYTTTPMCCPSRSSMLTGMYIHNHQVFTNHQNCSSPNWQNTHERRTFASYLSKAGYRTGYFGKYLNRYNGSHVPQGWHDWSGLIMNSRYYNYTVNKNSRHIKYGNRYPQDYYPHVITKDGINFLKENNNKHQDNPYLLVLSYPAPHGPEDSAPEHAHKYFNASDHHTASYNYAPNPDKQWVLQFTDRMPDIQLKFTDLLMTKRLQTLQTVDEAVERIANAVEELGEANNTYLFFTSDHGYHLGQYGLTKGKAMPFEFDIKVPFLVRGPGIKAGIQLPQVALNVDIAPTFLDIAGIPRPPQMDGRSLLPLLKATTAEGENKNPWRDSFLIESSGRVREEEVLERQEQRMWEREKALSLTLLKATSLLNSSSLVDGKGVNLYTSKHERLEEVCKGGEFSYPCMPTQKWHCVKLGDRWKMKKCRHKPTSPMWQKHCICQYHEGYGTYGKLGAIEKRKQKNFLKKYASKDLHSYGSKFIKAFNNVDIALSTVPRTTKYHRNKKRKTRRKRRYRRSVDEEEGQWFEGGDESSGFLPEDVIKELIGDVDDNKEELDDFESSEVEFAGTKPSVDLKLHSTTIDHAVHAFVEEEELKDLENQIFDITDELLTLESEKTTSAPLEVVNISATTQTTPSLGCHANMGHVDCKDEIYVNISAWKNSKAETEDQIKRLRQQLIVMKNILRHLQTKKPKKSPGNFESSSGAFDNSRLFVAKNFDNDTLEKSSGNDNHLSVIDDSRSVVDDFYYGSDDNETFGASTDSGSYDVYNEGKNLNGSFTVNANQFSTNLNNDMTQHTYIDKELTLPDVGLDLPIIEDVNYSKKPKSNRGKNGSNYSNQLKENINNNDLYFDNYEYEGRTDKEAFDVYNGDLFPIHLNELDDRLASTVKEPSHKICWCNRRIMKKMEIKETREKKRRERLEIKKKRQRKNFKRKHKKKEKAISCNYPKLNCYTHTNDHWKTPPLWTDGNFCFCINSANNTYWCLRTINDTHNYLYCEFITGLITFYDLHIDPYQLRNVAFTLSNDKVVQLHNKLSSLRDCKGADDCDGFAPRKQKEKEDAVKTKPTVSVDFGPLNNAKVKPNFDSDFSISAKKKKNKKVQNENKLKKHQKIKKFGNDIRLLEDPFSLSFSQNVRLPRKSHHRKEMKRQKRKEKKKMRRKRRKLTRQLEQLGKE